MAGGGPPTVRVFRQGAHLGATNRSGRLLATAIAHGRWRPRNQCGRLVGKGGGGCDSHQNRDANCLVEFLGSRCHNSLWNRALLEPIARWMEFYGIEVIEVLGHTAALIQKGLERFTAAVARPLLRGHWCVSALDVQCSWKRGDAQGIALRIACMALYDVFGLKMKAETSVLSQKFLHEVEHVFRG